MHRSQSNLPSTRVPVSRKMNKNKSPSCSRIVNVDRMAAVVFFSFLHRQVSSTKCYIQAAETWKIVNHNAFFRIMPQKPAGRYHNPSVSCKVIQLWLWRFGQNVSEYLITASCLHNRVASPAQPTVNKTSTFLKQVCWRQASHTFDPHLSSQSSIHSSFSPKAFTMAGNDENNTPPATPKGTGTLTTRENEILAKAIMCLKSPPEVSSDFKFSLTPTSWWSWLTILSHRADRLWQAGLWARHEQPSLRCQRLVRLCPRHSRNLQDLFFSFLIFFCLFRTH